MASCWQLGYEGVHAIHPSICMPRTFRVPLQGALAVLVQGAIDVQGAQRRRLAGSWALRGRQRPQQVPDALLNALTTGLPPVPECRGRLLLLASSCMAWCAVFCRCCSCCEPSAEATLHIVWACLVF